MKRKIIPAAPVTQSEYRRVITRIYIRHYSDNGQTMAYVEWSDGSRTEGHVKDATGALGIHMQALFDRGIREGLTIERETW